MGGGGTAQRTERDYSACVSIRCCGRAPIFPYAKPATGRLAAPICALQITDSMHADIIKDGGSKRIESGEPQGADNLAARKSQALMDDSQ